MPKWYPNNAQIMPKSCPNHTWIMPKSCPSHAQIMPKSCPNHAQIIPKSFLNHAQIIPKSFPKHPMYVSYVYHMCIMCAYMYIIGICHWHVSYVDIIRRYHVEISYGDVIYDTRSFMVSVALWGELKKKQQPAKPRMSLFEDGLLSHYDTGFRIYVTS